MLVEAYLQANVTWEEEWNALFSQTNCREQTLTARRRPINFFYFFLCVYVGFDPVSSIYAAVRLLDRALIDLEFQNIFYGWRREEFLKRTLNTLFSDFYDFSLT